MNRPEGFFQATNFVHPNLRDVVLAGVVARAVVEPGRDIESLQGRMSESERQAPDRDSRAWGGQKCGERSGVDVLWMTA